MRLLFTSPQCALDRTSGAAISVTTQLEELARLGWQCRALTGTVTSGHGPMDQHYASLGVRRAGHAAQSLLLGTHLNGVGHLIVPMHDTRRSRITSGDEQRYFDVVRDQLRNQRPDLLYIYGRGLLEQAILREARRRGIAAAFYLANDSYDDLDTFGDADAVFTPSRALADLYRTRLKLEAQPIGSFTRPLNAGPATIAAVLFVNPEAGKGASFLLAIARRCLSELPEARFLVVESRGTRESSARDLGVDWAECRNVAFLPRQQDLTAAFSATSIFLFPALHFDAAPRVIVEANHALRPVLASSQGGTPEMLDGAGSLIDVSPRCREAWTRLPDDDEVAPWVTHLKLLFRNEAAYAAAMERAAAAAQRHDLVELAELFSCRLKAVISSHRHKLRDSAAGGALN